MSHVRPKRSVARHAQKTYSNIPKRGKAKGMRSKHFEATTSEGTQPSVVRTKERPKAGARGRMVGELKRKCKLAVLEPRARERQMRECTSQNRRGKSKTWKFPKREKRAIKHAFRSCFSQTQSFKNEKPL